MTNIQPRKILLVSTDDSMLSVLTDRLSSEGHETHSVGDVSSAMDWIVNKHPDLVISGGDINGLVFLEAIRKSENQQIVNTPVIIASEDGDIVEIGRALNLGISDYFVKKALDPQHVVEKINRLFGGFSSVQPSVNSMPEEAEKVLSDIPNKREPMLKSKIKLLIVEDDKFLRDLASQKLSQENFDVIVAFDGEQGVSMAEKEVPDIILLDILLPGIDGFEVLKRIKANPELANTKVAMLSNFGQRDDIERALKLGAVQFMIKANYTLDEIVDEAKKISVS